MSKLDSWKELDKSLDAVRSSNGGSLTVSNKVVNYDYDKLRDLLMAKCRDLSRLENEVGDEKIFTADDVRKELNDIMERLEMFPNDTVGVVTVNLLTMDAKVKELQTV